MVKRTSPHIIKVRPALDILKEVIFGILPENLNSLLPGMIKIALEFCKQKGFR